MYSSAYEHHIVDTAQPFQGNNPTPLQNNIQGLISEVVYSEDNPWLTQLVLLPLLQQLGQQARWLLWLNPQKRLSRAWLQGAGLPLSKVMQPHLPLTCYTVETMAKALRTGNYSVVLACMEEELSDSDHLLLTNAAEEGGCFGFIMRPIKAKSTDTRPRSGLKIHSSLYH